jgi:hypothetical protein
MAPRLTHKTIAQAVTPRGGGPVVWSLRADGPLVSPSRDLDGEAPVAERDDDQPAAGVGGIRLGMAWRTERH